jgi:hypothetical protein
LNILEELLEGIDWVLLVAVMTAGLGVMLLLLLRPIPLPFPLLEVAEGLRPKVGVEEYGGDSGRGVTEVDDALDNAEDMGTDAGPCDMLLLLLLLLLVLLLFEGNVGEIRKVLSLFFHFLTPVGLLLLEGIALPRYTPPWLLLDAVAACIVEDESRKSQPEPEREIKKR